MLRLQNSGARFVVLGRIVLPAIVALVMVVMTATASAAQARGWVRAVVTEDGSPLRNATVQIPGTSLGALTGASGVAVVGPIAAGPQTIRIALIGHHTHQMTVDVVAGDTVTVAVLMMPSPVVLGGIDISVLRADLRPEVDLPERQIREANPHDVGAVLRSAPGLDAVRRGALGLDPVVRGLRDTQVGAYVDGMRTLPGGPGGMDTPLSHVDPSAVHGMEIIKGPYALTWGAGNMSAIRVETHPLPGAGAPVLSGSSFFGYDTNLDAVEAGLTLSGATGRFRYTTSGAWRQGDDYESGAGVTVPSSFESGEVRGRIGFVTSPTSLLTVAGGLQRQNDIDYAGRPLDADYFDATNASLAWSNTPVSGPVRSIDAQAYFYRVDHGMDNDDKPTALPDPDRMPPFPLDVVTYAGVDMVGGRLATELAPGGDWTLEIGGDAYTADHESHREIRRRDTGMLMSTNLIWGGARITDVGLFSRAERMFGPFTASGSVRFDLVQANADSASAFFLENASTNLESSEANFSGAFTLNLPVGNRYSVSLGAGSVVRTAEANERFSDRAPAKKAQIGAEFLGDPQIRPERSSQIDLWVEAAYPRVAASVNLFARRIDDHITIERTDLPTQSAMSAPMVFRYVNGTAEYLGAEATVVTSLHDDFSLTTSAAYLRGHDVTLDEPALGVTPLRGMVNLRWQPREDGRFVEAAVNAFDRQDRVATTRGEVATPGYATLDLQGGLRLPAGLFLRVGVNNLLDHDYANHLNSRNPFTGSPVAEPGRVFFTRIGYGL